MKKWLASIVLAATFLSTASAWRPAGWVYFNWPWAYDALSGQWHWFVSADAQWIHGYPPADGWREIENSAVAQGWSWHGWPFAFSPANSAWHYLNETDVQWAVEMDTGRWSLFGRLGPALSGDDLRAYWRDNSDLGVLMNGGSLAPIASDVSIDLLAKAEPDECFSGIPPMGPPPPANPALSPPPCSGSSIPKVNQAYVWGLAEAGGRLWFGTAANVHCLVLGSYLGSTNAHQTDSYVAEFGHSYYSQALGVPATLGDWRPPRIFRYDPSTNGLAARDAPGFLPPASLQRLRSTVGLRSAGAWPGSATSTQSLVFLAGPALSTNGGLNFFAFDAVSETPVGSATLSQYNNVRKWLLHDGALYTAVGKTGGGGAVLRWTDDPAAPGWPFAFEEIGALDGPGVELALHDGRLFVATWPGTVGQTQAALWMSPPIPPQGLSSAHLGGWQRVWRAGDYEPDPVVAATYGGGALASFDGHLYWGTMHVPGLAAAAHARIHGSSTNQDTRMAAFLGTHRAIAVFRASGFGQTTSPPAIELLYGAARLPKYSPADGGWVLAPNAMAARPRLGHSGLGNPFNNYCWTMDVFQNKLYLGTMDFSYLVFDQLPLYLSPLEELQLQLYFLSNNLVPSSFFGADLFRFSPGDAPAQAVSRQGLGNPTTYGVRTMVSTPSRLYLGMANPMNLLDEGGWELLSLSP